MQLVTELDNKYLQKIPKELKKKVLDIHQGNINFAMAVEANDLGAIRNLLEKDYPMAFNVFSQDEQYLIGDHLSEEWSENLHYISFSSIHAQGIKIENQALRDLFAEYWMYQRSIWYYLRKVYFACSTDNKKSLSYAKNLYESINFLHDEKAEWIMGALYHPDNQFFDDFFELHKQSSKPSQIFYPLSSSYYLQKSDKISYNFSSWCKYYEYYFEDAVQEKLNRPYYSGLRDYTRESAINDIFSEIYHKFKNVASQQFINFLNQEYHHFFGIEKLDLIEVSLAWHDKQEYDRKEYLRSITSRRQRSSFTRKNKDEFLKSAIMHAVQNNPADVCEDVFEKINLDKSYYKSLTQYLDLSSQLNLKIGLEEKVNKI
jgi:hypothetical protein